VEISGKNDLSDPEYGIVNVPACYGGNASFAITKEVGPWCSDTVGDEESKDISDDGYCDMIEQEDDQVNLLDDRVGFDMGDLRAQLSMGKSIATYFMMLV
jgi:hypothetical protein